MPMARAADAAKPRDEGSKSCAGSRYSPKRDQLARTSSSVEVVSVEVYPLVTPVLVR